MVTQMNKEQFINELVNELKYSKEQCILINNILENNFFISKKKKDKIISEFVINLSISIEEATKVYDVCKKIINEQIKYKLSHPFKNKD